ncbi:MAG TPA: amidohydrolase family protein [Xanthobacteraceae bacterium]|jgi:cytosine/adenosine deaminase-related metal-dependent hydrolase
MMPAGNSILIKGAIILPAAGAALQRSDILIRDGRIAAIEAHGQLDQCAASARAIEGRGKLVIPGLVNAHYHSHDVLSRGMFEDIPLELWIALAILPPTRLLSAREVRLRTLLGAIECLRNGITTVQDMLGCGPGAEQHVETVIAAYQDVGIRCVLSLQVGNRSAVDCLPGARETLPAHLLPLLSSEAPDVRRIIDFVAAPLALPHPPRLHWAIAPGSPQRCTFELLAGLADLANRYGLPVVTHINESKLQVYLARDLYHRYGGSALDYLNAAGLLNSRLCMAHCVWLSDEEIARTAQANAAIVTNPVSNLKLKNGIAPLRKFRQAGIRLAIGCDNVSAGDAQSMFEAMKLVCNLSAGKGTCPSGFSAVDAMAMATTGGAGILGLSDAIGGIAVGKTADLVLIDLSELVYLPLNNAVRQLVYGESGRGVHTVIVDGTIVVDDRRVTTVDYAALVSEAAEVGEIYAADCRRHGERLADATPYILDVVRRHGAQPLHFDRWLLAGDGLAGEPG